MMQVLGLLVSPMTAWFTYLLLFAGISALRDGERMMAFALLIQGALCGAGTVGMIADGLGVI